MKIKTNYKVTLNLTKILYCLYNLPGTITNFSVITQEIWHEIIQNSSILKFQICEWTIWEIKKL